MNRNLCNLMETFLLLGHKSAAPDFQSYDVKGFQKFCQYLAKNGKKTPKSEAVITPAILQQYAKQTKQAKLEEFRSFLDFTAMKFRDRRKHKIENFVTGRWVLTMKTDNDGKFKKFKARWVCRGFQDAQKWDLQTESPTATRYGFCVASQHAASMYWDLLHVDLKTAFLQGETCDLERRVIHVQLSDACWFVYPFRLRSSRRSPSVVESLRQVFDFPGNTTN